MTLSSTAVVFLSQDKTEDELLNELLYGIEIEFSDAGDLVTDSDECPYTDSDAEEYFQDSDNAADWLIARFSPDGETQSVRRMADAILSQISLEDFVNATTSYSWDRLIQRQLESMASNWEPENDTSEGFQDVVGWIHCEDGTSGIIQEYKSSGPRSFADIKRDVQRLIASATMNGGDPVVPLDGSNHVHVSIRGCRHAAGDHSLLHCCILFELNQMLNEIPSNVIERYKYNDSYFRLEGTPQQKYSAVHCHHSGTWEFRLFGHCVDIDGINENIRLAGLAFLRGYKRFHERRYSSVDVYDFRMLFRKRMLDEELMSESEIYNPSSADVVPVVPETLRERAERHLSLGRILNPVNMDDCAEYAFDRVFYLSGEAMCDCFSCRMSLDSLLASDPHDYIRQYYIPENRMVMTNDGWRNIDDIIRDFDSANDDMMEAVVPQSDDVWESLSGSYYDAE